jgi:hypothetical protein
VAINHKLEEENFLMKTIWSSTIFPNLREEKKIVEPLGEHNFVKK